MKKAPTKKPPRQKPKPGKPQARKVSPPRKPRHPEHPAAQATPARRRPLTAVMTALWTKDLAKQEKQIQERAKPPVKAAT